MKRKLKLTYAIATVAIAAGALIGVKNLDSRDNLTEIQLENIAALSDDGEGERMEVCYNDIHTKDGCEVRYCGTCTIIPGADDFFSPADKCKAK